MSAYVYLPNIFCSNTSQNAQLRADTLSLQTAWTGFDPNLYSGGLSSAGPALVEIACIFISSIHTTAPETPLKLSTKKAKMFTDFLNRRKL